MQKSHIHSLYRIIDANANRLKEGLRVCEEIARFVINDKLLTKGFKDIRHKASALINAIDPGSRLIVCRKADSDVGRPIHTQQELKRSGFADIIYANIQRAKESLRVLEEFSKLIDRRSALGFKELRYRIYELEQKMVVKIK